MTAKGIQAYGLLGFHCQECGRPKSNRIFSVLTGCRECDEAITRHRCTERPERGSLATGVSWECPDCGSVWTAVMQPDTCGECGRSGEVPGWDFTEGPRMGTAPRYDPPPLFTPFRNLLPQGWHRDPPSLPSECYRARAGFMVHIRGACACRGHSTP